jgi:hypothetical protein
MQVNRRAFLNYAGGGLGLLALAHLDAAERTSGRGAPPLAPKASHFPAKAKSVICLFQHGGVSQVDTFDPKPVLTKYDGQEYPGKGLEIHFHKEAGKLLKSPFAFQKHGQSGVEVSELLPHTAKIVDSITLIRSMTTGSIDHEQALRLFHTGKIPPGRPTWGSWVIYGLGTERQDLPAFVVLSDPEGLPVDGIRNWSSGWLPAIYQGTQIRSEGVPVFNLMRPDEIPAEARMNQLGLLNKFNKIHLARHSENSELEARISNYEMAAKMQTSVPEALDLESEPESIRKLYGLNSENKATADYAKRCLMARRLVQRGVRFVEVFLSGQPWDTHQRNSEKVKTLCRMTDQPSAALVADLQQSGLLDSTIVLWATEFGRMPISQGTDGRDHNRRAFTVWAAGGGFKRGYVHGTTDDFGAAAELNPVTPHDLHATILHALGLDHQRLTYPHEGREDSLTDVAVSKARVMHDLLA